MNVPQELFLSHSSQNYIFARRLASCIQAHGVPVWFSGVSKMTSSRWHDEIGKALDRCDWLAVILTPISVTSKWVKQELIYALQENRYEDHIIPILYKGCDFTKLSWTLKNIEYIDFRVNHQAGFYKLFNRWGISFNGSSV